MSVSFTSHSSCVATKYPLKKQSIFLLLVFARPKSQLDKYLRHNRVHRYHQLDVFDIFFLEVFFQQQQNCVQRTLSVNTTDCLQFTELTDHHLKRYGCLILRGFGLVWLCLSSSRLYSQSSLWQRLWVVRYKTFLNTNTNIYTKSFKHIY